jgi:hypothetical protein
MKKLGIGVEVLLSGCLNTEFAKGTEKKKALFCG